MKLTFVISIGIVMLLFFLIMGFLYKTIFMLIGVISVICAIWLTVKFIIPVAEWFNKPWYEK